MVIQTNRTRFSALSISLHWLMLLLIVGAYASMELREGYPRGSDTRELFKTVHYMIGISVLALVVVRIAARLLTPGPAPLDEPAWRSLLARLVHLALYGFMIAMPIAGWLILSGEGDAIPFGLPPLAAPSIALAGQMEELHEAGANLGYLLVGLHAVASLFHHFVLRDGLLNRMRFGRA
ncbi:MAG: cytochrome b [Croceibacterium sp.]